MRLARWQDRRSQYSSPGAPPLLCPALWIPRHLQDGSCHCFVPHTLGPKSQLWPNVTKTRCAAVWLHLGSLVEAFTCHHQGVLPLSCALQPRSWVRAVTFHHRGCVAVALCPNSWALVLAETHITGLHCCSSLSCPPRPESGLWSTITRTVLLLLFALHSGVLSQSSHPVSPGPSCYCTLPLSPKPPLSFVIPGLATAAFSFPLRAWVTVSPGRADPSSMGDLHVFICQTLAPPPQQVHLIPGLRLSGHHDCQPSRPGAKRDPLSKSLPPWANRIRECQ